MIECFKLTTHNDVLRWELDLGADVVVAAPVVVQTRHAFSCELQRCFWLRPLLDLTAQALSIARFIMPCQSNNLNADVTVEPRGRDNAAQHGLCQAYVQRAVNIVVLAPEYGARSHLETTQKQSMPTAVNEAYDAPAR